MKRQTWIIGLAAVVVAALMAGAGAAMDEAAHDAGAGRMGHGLGAMMGQPWRLFITGQIGRGLVLRSQFNLSEQQKDKLKTIVQGHKAEIQQVGKELLAEHRALRDSVLAEKADEKAVRAAAEGMTKGIGDAAVLITRIKAEAWPVLTAEQRQAVEAFRVDSDKAVDQFLAQLGQETVKP